MRAAPSSPGSGAGGGAKDFFLSWYNFIASASASLIRLDSTAASVAVNPAGSNFEFSTNALFTPVSSCFARYSMTVNESTSSGTPDVFENSYCSATGSPNASLISVCASSPCLA